MVFAGAPILASDLNAPTCHLVQQSAQTGWTSNTMTVVTFGSGSEVLDTDTLHDTASNNSRIVIGKRLGWWKISGVYAGASNSATSILRSCISKNGTEIDGSFGGIQLSSTGSLYTVATPTILVQATSATDYIELKGSQSAGSGTIGTLVSGTARCSLTAIWKPSA